MSESPSEATVDLSLVLPAFNEARNLEVGLPVAIAAFEATGRSFEVVVVDDGSSDRTAEVVREWGARDPRVRLVQHSANAGYGAALRSGFREALGQWVMFTDADFQFDLKEVGRLLAHVHAYDIVAGYRSPRRDPWNRRLNAWAWGRLVNATFDLRIRDVNCAFKLFRREVLEGAELRSDGAFVNTELLARARSRGWRIQQVPVSHYKRTTGVQTGAQPKVVAKAFVELAQLYGDLQSARRGVRQAAARTVVHLSAVAAR